MQFSKKAGSNRFRPFCLRDERAAENPLLRHRDRCRGPTKATPDETRWDEEQCRPKQEWQAEFKKDAENESSGRENGADSLDKGIAELKRETREIGLQRGAVIFQQSETDMSLGDG